MKLSDKETTAFAQKVRAIAVKENEATRKQLAKFNTAAAKKVWQLIQQIPDAVKKELFKYSCSSEGVTVTRIADLLVDEKKLGKVADIRDFEADVTIKAMESKTLAELCKKIGI